MRRVLEIRVVLEDNDYDAALVEENANATTKEGLEDAGFPVLSVETKVTA